MKMKTIFAVFTVLALAWMFLFQAAQPVSSSPAMRITVTPSLPPTLPPTLPPPPTVTNPPLIPVTGTDQTGGQADLLIVGGVGLLMLGVVGLAWPAKRKA